jgi:hypothetical protein
MDQTPRGFHFPEGGDPLGDVNLAVQQLAEDVDAFAVNEQAFRDDVNTRPTVRSGDAFVVHPGGSPGVITGRVEFGHQFPAPPRVVGSLPSANCKDLYIYAVDATGFQVQITPLNQGVFTYPLTWMAHG